MDPWGYMVIHFIIVNIHVGISPFLYSQWMDYPSNSPCFTAPLSARVRRISPPCATMSRSSGQRRGSRRGGKAPFFPWKMGISPWNMGISPWKMGISPWKMGISPWNIGDFTMKNGDFTVEHRGVHHEKHGDLTINTWISWEAWEACFTMTQWYPRDVVAVTDWHIDVSLSLTFTHEKIRTVWWMIYGCMDIPAVEFLELIDVAMLWLARNWALTSKAWGFKQPVLGYGRIDCSWSVLFAINAIATVELHFFTRESTDSLIYQWIYFRSSPFSDTRTEHLIAL